MSTARTLAPTRRLLSTPWTHQLQLQLPRRTFITLPAPPPQTLTASRRLPYLHTQLYDLIADVDSYVTFLPYCQTSRVTHWTTPSASPSQDSQDPNPSSRRWPTRADLTAGWGGFQETYTSRLFCVPALGIVEAISGDARTLIPSSELRKYGLVDPDPSPSPSLPNSSSSSSPGSGEDGGVFKSLVTRWTVTPASSGGVGVGGEESAAGWSDVRLSIRYQFANPLYMAVSAAVADKVAPVMVEAFVERARRILGEPGKGEKKKSAEALR